MTHSEPKQWHGSSMRTGCLNKTPPGHALAVNTNRVFSEQNEYFCTLAEIRGPFEIANNRVTRV